MSSAVRFCRLKASMKKDLTQERTVNEGGMVHRISLVALKHMTGTNRRGSLHMIILTKLVTLGELLPVAVAHHTGFKKLAFNTDRQSFAELRTTLCINPLWHAGPI